MSIYVYRLVNCAQRNSIGSIVSIVPIIIRQLIVTLFNKLTRIIVFGQFILIWFCFFFLFFDWNTDDFNFCHSALCTCIRVYTFYTNILCSLFIFQYIYNTYLSETIMQSMFVMSCLVGCWTVRHLWSTPHLFILLIAICFVYTCMIGG